MLRNWEDPAYRRRHSERMSKRQRENWQNPEYREKIHSWHPTLHESSGTIMRSSWEVNFADWLDGHQIVWEYEAYRFVYRDGLDEHIYIPDFYLPDLNLFIEVKSVIFINNTTEAKSTSVRSSGYEIILMTEKNWDAVLEQLEKR